MLSNKAIHSIKSMTKVVCYQSSDNIHEQILACSHLDNDNVREQISVHKLRQMKAIAYKLGKLYVRCLLASSKLSYSDISPLWKTRILSQS